MPRVSVVMPCYNAERFVGAAIGSVLQQTYCDLEIIVVDDGSTDRSPEIVSGFSDPRVRYVRQTNGGPAKARNTGMRLAAGEFVAFLDADDLALPERVAVQLAALEADPDLAVVAGGYVWIDEHGHELPWPYHAWQSAPDMNRMASWLVDCPVVPSATMLRHQAWADVGGFDEDLVGPEDWNFWMRLAVTHHRFAWNKEVVCLYRRTAGSLSEDAQRMSANCPEALQRVLDRPDFPQELLPLGQRALAIRYIDGAKRLYRSGLWEKGKSDLREAIRLDAGLIHGAPSRIEDEIISASLEPLVKDPIGFLGAVLANLPENASPLLARREHLLARGHLELLARGLREGQYRLVLRLWLPMLLKHPGWLLNRSMWAVVVRALSNRWRRVKTRLRPRAG